MPRAVCGRAVQPAGRCVMSDGGTRHDLAPRAARFACRIAGDAEPAFADWQRLGRIERIVAGRRDTMAELVAMLDARPAIDSELNGSRLSALANRVGEAQFDRICEAVIAPALYHRGRTTLPDPHMLQPLGEALLQCHQRSADALLLARIAADIDISRPQTQVAA